MWNRIAAAVVLTVLVGCGNGTAKGAPSGAGSEERHVLPGDGRFSRETGLQTGTYIRLAPDDHPECFFAILTQPPEPDAAEEPYDREHVESQGNGGSAQIQAHHEGFYTENCGEWELQTRGALLPIPQVSAVAP
jgi:hypothetical protein